MKGHICDFVRVMRIPCREHAALYSRRLDADVSWGARAGLAVHERLCPGCRAMVRQLEQLRAAARSLAGRRPQPAPAPCSPACMPDLVRARLEHALLEQDGT